MYKEIEKFEDENENQILRDLDVVGYRFFLYDTYKTDRYGKSVLGYLFYDKKGYLLFSGEDYGCSPLHSIDSDDSVTGLLGFLTLKKGDTDEEYFQDYTPEQIEFSESMDCEDISLFLYDFENKDENPEYHEYQPDMSFLKDWE